jgi:hypothetical protein
VRGLGLYAARRFKKDDYVGRYRGDTKGWYRSRKEALDDPKTKELVRKGHDKLVTVRAKGGGVHLLDGDGYGPPYVHLCNDPRNTRLKANADLTDAGWLRITQTHVPAFDLEKTLEENAKSELRFSYGDEYWDIHDRLGRSTEYALQVD